MAQLATKKLGRKSDIKTFQVKDCGIKYVRLVARPDIEEAIYLGPQNLAMKAKILIQSTCN